MKVINLYAGPGSGKSTSAAVIFGYLKNMNCNVELVREFAKEVVYEKSDHVLKNQIYVTAIQYKRLKDLQNYGIKLVITDSPLLLGLVYCEKHSYFKEYKDLLFKLNEEFDNFNILVKRAKPYNPSGRLQTENESDDITKKLKEVIAFDKEIFGLPAHQEEAAEYIFRKFAQDTIVGV